MYLDEYDLSWRVWLSGHAALAVPSARLHHRGAAQVNPEGGVKVVEFRTSDMKRFFGGRNGLLTVLKNGQNVLLLMVPAQLILLVLEALVGLLLVRRWSFVKHAYLDAIADCWRLRTHVVAARRQLSVIRQRSDWQMLRFLRLLPNRWYEISRIRKEGVPKVTAG
jgi:GT2 family glycosyltransferase